MSQAGKTLGADRRASNQVHAAAAKMGVNSLTRSFALEWADYGIRAVGISPG
jgi:NAD(P)-dependent dehydrogenase (short-subunit alcohol dehydrogenase family)